MLSSTLILSASGFRAGGPASEIYVKVWNATEVLRARPWWQAATRQLPIPVAVRSHRYNHSNIIFFTTGTNSRGDTLI